METHSLVECIFKNYIKSSLWANNKVLPGLISSQQTAYIKNKHIGESGRLVSDIIENAKIKTEIGF